MTELGLEMRIVKVGILGAWATVCGGNTNDRVGIEGSPQSSERSGVKLRLSFMLTYKVAYLNRTVHTDVSHSYERKSLSVF